jgi:hypothetical protein
LPQQILCRTDGSFDYAIRVHVGKFTRGRVTSSWHSEITKVRQARRSSCARPVKLQARSRSKAETVPLDSKGNLVSFHCHAVVWATHYSQLSRCRKRIKPRFSPILGNKSGVRFDALKKAEDVCKAVRYQAKMPALGYRTVAQGWGKKTQTSAKLSYLSRYRLFTALQQYDLLDFWLAGGEGATILRQARTKLNEHRERQRLGPAGDSPLRYSSRLGFVGARLRAF